MSADLKPDKGRGHIAIPTETMEQEFQNHYRKGYEAATSAAKAKIAALEAERDDWHDRATEAQSERDTAREERDALMARVAELEKAGAPMANTMFNLAQREHWPAFERESFKAMQVAWDSASSAAGEATNG